MFVYELWAAELLSDSKNCALTCPVSNSTGLFALTTAKQAHTFAENGKLLPPPSLFKGTESWKRRRCGEKCVSKRELIWALHSNSRRMTVFADTGATLNSLKIKSNKANIQVVRLPGGNGLSDYNLCGKVVPWPFLPLYVYCSTGRSKVHWLLAPKMKLNQTLRAMIVKRLHLQDKKCIFSRAREMKEIIF